MYMAYLSLLIESWWNIQENGMFDQGNKELVKVEYTGI